MRNAIDINEYIHDGAPGAIALATAFMEASTRSMTGGVTYVYSDGDIIAAISPPEAAERYEHQGEVEVQVRQHQENVPVLVRTERPRLRRRWLGPFEGVF
jgi:hypothetical protein